MLARPNRPTLAGRWKTGGIAATAVALLVGQVEASGGLVKVFGLEGRQVVPPASSKAAARATVVLRGRQGRVRLWWRDLSGRPLRLELRGPALPGQRAGTLYTLDRPARPLGVTDSLEATFPVSQSRKKLFRDELVYLTVTTPRHPFGELRGQVVITEEEDEDE